MTINQKEKAAVGDPVKGANDDDEDSVTPRCQVQQNDKEEYVTHEGRSRFYGDPDPRSNDNEASDARSTESTSATVELNEDTQRRENEEKE